MLVCLLAMQNLWFDKLSTKTVISLESYGLAEPFIFYPAITWPHKNHLGLLKAIACLRDTHNLIIHAVFTGHQTEFFTQIRQTVNQLGLEQQVQFLGVVTEDVLFALYHAARAVVVPTLYEAGSFPLMESMLMGIPVVCSNVTSLPDTIGNGQFVFNAIDVADIADKVRKVCFDADYRRENVENSSKQAVKLRNNDALGKLTKALATLHNG